MPKTLRAYVRVVETVNRTVGRATMLLIFVLMGILLYSSFMKLTAVPPLWGLEMAQFVMAAYYLLGGAYSLQLGDHVRMDLAYGLWSDRTKAKVDTVTLICLVVYLCFLLYGGLSSTEYALQYGERSYSSWRPYMAPIKIVMCVGILLTLLQVTAEMIKDFARARGEEA
jgi:TRAP-type mannitol/chloroaromatic compound transport system permease small subunit